MFRYLLFLVNYCIWWRVRTKPLPFTYGYPVCPPPMYGKNILAPYLAVFLKHQVTTDIWVYFSNLNLFHRSVCLSLCQYHRLLITIAYCIFWTWEMLVLPPSIFLFQDCICFSGCLAVPHNFMKEPASFYKGVSWDHDRYVPNLRSFGD